MAGFPFGRGRRRFGRWRNRPLMFGPPAAGGGVPPRVRQLLAEGNRLMNQGQYEDAAEIFEALASQAEQRVRPVWAGRLFLLAGQALAGAGRSDEALNSIQHGLDILRVAIAPDRLRMTGGHVVVWLRTNEQPALADQVERLLPSIGDPSGTLAQARSTSQATKPGPGRLPAKCPHCGGTVHSDQVEWIDSTSAECEYCGSVLHASS